MTQKNIIQRMKPGIDAVLDAVAIVNSKNELIYANLAMKSFLGLNSKDMNQTVFCDRIKLSVCEKNCCILNSIQTLDAYRADEIPASKTTKGRTEKIKLTVKVVPFEEENEKGAIITLRDTTAEVLLQAKYHKIMQILQDQN